MKESFSKKQTRIATEGETKTVAVRLNEWKLIIKSIVEKVFNPNNIFTFETKPG